MKWKLPGHAGFVNIGDNGGQLNDVIFFHTPLYRGPNLGTERRVAATWLLCMIPIRRGGGGGGG